MSSSKPGKPHGRYGVFTLCAFFVDSAPAELSEMEERDGSVTNVPSIRDKGKRCSASPQKD
jgi:hypothetical protein